MLFRIIRDEKGIMATDYISCIPDEETLNIMQKFGYKFNLNGAFVSIPTIIKFVRENQSKKEK